VHYKEKAMWQRSASVGLYGFPLRVAMQEANLLRTTLAVGPQPLKKQVAKNSPSPHHAPFDRGVRNSFEISYRLSEILLKSRDFEI